MSVSSIRTVLFDLAPSLVTVDEGALGRIDRFISRASNKINQDAAGDDYDEAIALLTWHDLLMSGLDGTGDESRGQLLEEKNDNASAKYAAASISGGPHGETSPGRRLDSLMESWVPDPWVW